MDWLVVLTFWSCWSFADDDNLSIYLGATFSSTAADFFCSTAIFLVIDLPIELNLKKFIFFIIINKFEIIKVIKNQKC